MTVNVANHDNAGYQQGCRCEACRKDHNAYSMVYDRANRKAAKWVRGRYPGVFHEFLAEAHEEAGRPQRPRGRAPRKAAR